VTGDGSQFTFDNGLTASAAIADGYSATATTTEQVGGQMYTVTVASTVTDTLGAGIDIAANSTVFPGYQPPAVVRINEINANLAFGCDLIELRVITGGAMGGISLRERSATLVTFSHFSLAAGDIIVVHLDTADSRCNSAGSSDETVTASEQPNATYPENYDSAFDWYSDVSGISATTQVLTLYDPVQNIMDAVLLTSDALSPVHGDAEARAAEAAAVGEWQMVGGGVPKGGFVGNNFNAHAVLDLDATTDTDSIQRDDDADNNDLSDWTTDLDSWGVINAGQSN
ncbi:MAG: hypothetical protein R3330_10715, partial [Saprospiraceae bacterium]|nr:hypothetical protein [Saprospiraceae bacterium]